MCQKVKPFLQANAFKEKQKVIQAKKSKSFSFKGFASNQMLFL
jgi:hypothetical protein